MNNKDQLKAIYAIKNYLNVMDNPKFTNDYIIKNYGVAIDMIIDQANNCVKKAGVSEFTEGNTRIVYEDGFSAWSITGDIAKFLPSPFIRVMG